MKRTLPFFLLLLVAGCKKDTFPVAYGEVIDKGGCFADSWMVKLSDPDPEKYSFLCPASEVTDPGVQYSCNNSVYIKLPANLAQSGKKIKFSRWVDMGSCLALSYAPSHIELSDVSEQ